MTSPNELPLNQLQFYLSAPYPCSYLPSETAQSLMATPQHLVNASIYSHLIGQGFRRSGDFAYRPHCPHCQACVSIRVVLKDFTPNRSQKRAFKQHQHLTIRILPVDFHEAHFALYSAYIKARHTNEQAESEQDTDNKDEPAKQTEKEQYHSFLCQSHVDSVLVEFSDNDQLKMVSVVDIVDDGMSAVYTFYDTSDAKASLGTYNVLWQIEWAKSFNLPYLYLGYWIKDSQKMAYKQNFQPQQQLVNGTWQNHI